MYKLALLSLGALAIAFASHHSAAAGSERYTKAKPEYSQSWKGTLRLLAQEDKF